MPSVPPFPPATVGTPAIMSFGGGDNPILFFNNVSAPKDPDIGTNELEFTVGSYTMSNINIPMGETDEVIFVPPNAPTTSIFFDKILLGSP